jgi:hypothetical protein
MEARVSDARRSDCPFLALGLLDYRGPYHWPNAMSLMIQPHRASNFEDLRKMPHPSVILAWSKSHSRTAATLPPGGLPPCTQLRGGD